MTGEGPRLVEYRSTDEAGNAEEVGSLTVKVDTAAPVVTAAETGRNTKTVTLTAEDAASGVAGIEYRVDDATEWTTYSGPIVLDTPGTHTVRYRAADEAGNRSTGQIEVVVTGPGEPPEPAKPTVTLATEPAAADGRGNWFTGPVTVTLAGAGGDGALALEYRIGNGPWTAYTTPVRVTDDGVTRVQGRATDAEGTTSAIGTLTVKIDSAAPSIVVGGIGDGARLRIDAVRTVRAAYSDATSGVAETMVRLDGVEVGTPARLEALMLTTGRHRLEVSALDEAGNRATRSVTFRVVANYGAATKVLKRLVRDDEIGRRLADRLTKQLKKARRSPAPKALKALKRFERLTRLVDDKEVRTALQELARALKARL